MDTLAGYPDSRGRQRAAAAVEPLVVVLPGVMP